MRSECGTRKTVKARFWPWLSGNMPARGSRCSLFARRALRAKEESIVIVDTGTIMDDTES